MAYCFSGATHTRLVQIQRLPLSLFIAVSWRSTVINVEVTSCRHPRRRCSVSSPLLSTHPVYETSSPDSLKLNNNFTRWISCSNLDSLWKLCSNIFFLLILNSQARNILSTTAYVKYCFGWDCLLKGL